MDWAIGSSGALEGGDASLRDLEAPEGKYRRFPEFAPVLEERGWIHREITHPPIWCSVDLRDGNQALPNPMDVATKLRFFDLLTRIGFEHIEVGFPAASETEFQFVRALVETSRIRDRIFPQVLTQAREDLIARTFESLRGAPRAIVHLYNSTSAAQREIVFGKDVEEITELACRGVQRVMDEAARSDVAVQLEYSPESFTGTEPSVARDVCLRVIETWSPTLDRPMIINLPATVEMYSPDRYADYIEWMVRQFAPYEGVTVSLHPHNDRGGAVTAAEFGVRAGATRVEGTLFGNGERTGNVDLVTVALNMFADGIHPGLRLGDLPYIAGEYEACTGMDIPARHPYSGTLVYTAFSGSHQDAISKGMVVQRPGDLWRVPYLPIDPADVGRGYEPVIRVNSQSGKGGVAFVMRDTFSCDLPKAMHPEFGGVVKEYSDRVGGEVSASALWEIFRSEYLEPNEPFIRECLVGNVLDPISHTRECRGSAIIGGRYVELKSHGNGPLDALSRACMDAGVPSFGITAFHEHARGIGSDAEAVAYVCVTGEDGRARWGVGIDADTEQAAEKALVSALNRLMRRDAH